MRTSVYLLATLREDPKEAEVISHKLMLRGGLIRKLASGVYNWLPLGFRVLKKIEKIIREEMDKVGMEVLMPALQPAELWIESGRWNMYGDQLLKMQDRNQHALCFAPTHEEVITYLVKNEVRSYKQLPLVFYQIQTKFRDELRPRFGVMRSREFIMKDGYSFHLDEESMHDTYTQLSQTYSRIFERLGLKFRVVFADSGSIGGNRSQEFQVIAAAGEDLIAYCEESDYAANLEFAEALKSDYKTDKEELPKEKVLTPGVKTVEQVAGFFSIEKKQILKTLIVKGKNDPWVALMLRGDHELNEIKAAKIPEVYFPLTFANEEKLYEICGCERGSIGPINLKMPIIADQEALQGNNFVCGANTDSYHYRNVNWGRDLAVSKIYDLRNVVEGDISPDGKGKLKITRGIEVGHIFELERKYSKALGAKVLDEKGKEVTLYMGCYGIGVSRLVAAAIEQCHDERGIVWPISLAPFSLVIIPIDYHRSKLVREFSEQLYEKFKALGIEVILEDRKERIGVIFSDMDLIGIPHRLVISESNLEKKVIEYKARKATEVTFLKIDEVLSYIVEKIKNELEV